MKQPFNKIISICLPMVFLIIFQVNSQKFVVDVIHLKNGDVYKGIIVDQADPEILRIETLCQNTMNFYLKDILSVTSEEFKPWSARMPFTPGPKGYLNITDFGILIGTGNNNQNAIFSLSSFNGYGLSSKHIVGGGLGIEFFETLLLPVYFESRRIITNRKFTPFFNLKAGYSFALEDPRTYWEEEYNTTGGYLWGAGIGTLIWTGNHNAFEINILYRRQDIKTIKTYERSDYTTTITQKYNRLELRFGFLFQ